MLHLSCEMMLIYNHLHSENVCLTDKKKGLLKAYEKVSRLKKTFYCIRVSTTLVKGQNNSSKKRTNEFVFTTMRCIFVPFLEEIEGIQKTFRNYLTFSCGNTFAIRPFWGHSKKMVTGMLSLGFIGHFC